MAWSEDVPVALTQGKTIEEAKEDLIDALHPLSIFLTVITSFTYNLITLKGRIKSRKQEGRDKK